MEGIKKQRTALKRKITRACNTVETAKDSAGALKRVSEQLRGLSSEVDEMTTKIIEVDTEENSEECLKENEELLDKLWGCEIQVAEYLHDLTEGPARGARADVRSAAGGSVLKLPDLQLPKFSGLAVDWVSFSDLFTASVINNGSLAEAQKFQFLKSTLSGAALSLIQGLQVCDDNFSVAWETLRARYYHPRQLVLAQVKRLVDQPAVTHPSKLHQLIDTTSEVLRALDALGRSQERGNDLLVYLLIQRLDDNTREAWELSRKDKLPVQAEELIDFLDNRARAFICPDIERGSIAPSKQQSRNNTTRVQSYVATTSGCSFCKESHNLWQCRRFIEKGPQERKRFVQQKNLCFNCLDSSHTVGQCQRSSCKKCNKRHHTLLHFERSELQGSQRTPPRNNYHARAGERRPAEARETSSTSSNPSSGHNQVNTQNVLSNMANQAHTVLLQTAAVFVTDIYGRTQEVRCLLDSGSQGNFATKACAQRLGLVQSKTEVQIRGLTATDIEVCKSQAKVQITSRFDPTLHIEADVLIVPTITELQPRQYLDEAAWSSVRKLPLADSRYNQPLPVEMLLGAEIVAQISTGQVLSAGPDKPTAIQTRLGWVLTGRVSTTGLRPQADTITVNHLNLQTDRLLERFWEVDSVPQTSSWTAAEKEVEVHFKTTHTRLADGRYCVRIPFINGVPELGDSRRIAQRRYNCLEGKLSKNLEAAKEYHEVLEEYLSLGHMRQVSQGEEADQRACYLPHHAVIKESSTSTRVRVVFDASCKTTNGRSLNDEMHAGPGVQDSLFDILLRFRTYRYVLNADISKMYRYIAVDERDQKYQRILWRRDPDQPVQIFQLQTVTFGTKAAPFLATRALLQLANDEEMKYPLAARAVRESFYMDDVLSGGDSITEVTELRKQLQEMLLTGGFNLTKWMSNHPKILNMVQEAEAEKELNEVALRNLLGLQWHPVADYFTFKYQPEEKNLPVTKRVVLSKLAHIFDPQGWLAPVTTWAKIFIQCLWQLKLEWDQPLPAEQQNKWQQFEEQLEVIQQVKIPRFMGITPTTEVQLHAFCDSSERAYAAVVYLRAQTGTHIETHLVASKTKVSPIRTLSIPRLELCGAVLLSNLLCRIQQALNIPSEKTFAWTDSQIVLCWLSGNANQWQCFVANRVGHIQETIPNVKWFHIQGTSNPADIPSRGLLPARLSAERMWWSGPDLLNEVTVPFTSGNLQEVEAPERKKIVTVNTATEVLNINQHLGLPQRLSSWQKMVNVTAYILRFVSNSASKCGPYFCGSLKIGELERATTVQLRAVQAEYFSAEVRACQQGIPLHSGSKLLPLDPFLDKEGLLRVGGRLQQAHLSYTEKHPVILPGAGRLTELLLDSYHKKLLHAGPQLMLNTVRQKYWIVHGRNATKAAYHRCMVCFRYRTEARTQKMAQLPSARVNIARTFSKTAVDFAGPIMLKAKRGRNFVSYKGYVAVFICMASHAVHIEAVTGLSAEDFMAAHRRITARRGRIEEYFLDNGTNFKGADGELRRLLQQACRDYPEIQGQLAQEGTLFHYGTPGAPSQNGYWEAAIRSAKKHLVRLQGIATWTYEEMATYLCQIEAILNSRPITPMSSEAEDLTALTPGHFLTGTNLLTVPEPNYEGDKLNYNRRYKLLQQQLQGFWKSWSKSYLQTLQTRCKWQKTQENIKVGDLVILRSQNLPPARWDLAKVIAVHAGVDGLVRNVTLKTGRGNYQRPIQAIARLPASD